MDELLKQAANLGDFTLTYHGIADIWGVFFIDMMVEGEEFLGATPERALSRAIEYASNPEWMAAEIPTPKDVAGDV